MSGKKIVESEGPNRKNIKTELVRYFIQEAKDVNLVNSQKKVKRTSKGNTSGTTSNAGNRVQSFKKGVSPLKRKSSITHLITAIDNELKRQGSQIQFNERKPKKIVRGPKELEGTKRKMNTKAKKENEEEKIPRSVPAKRQEKTLIRKLIDTMLIELKRNYIDEDTASKIANREDTFVVGTTALSVVEEVKEIEKDPQMEGCDQSKVGSEKRGLEQSMVQTGHRVREMGDGFPSPTSSIRARFLDNPLFGVPRIEGREEGWQALAKRPPGSRKKLRDPVVEYWVRFGSRKSMGVQYTIDPKLGTSKVSTLARRRN